MIVTFAPPGSPPRTWIFDPDTFPQPDSERVEELTGLLWEEAKEAIVKGGAKVRRALVYCFERRDHPSLSWASFGDFPAGAISVEFTKDEIEALAKQVESAPGLSDASRAETLAGLAGLLEAAPDTPKAPVPHGVPATPAD